MSGPLWMFVLIALLLMGLSVPLVLRRVAPNFVYGLRVPATFRDERVWYEANAASGRELFALGAALLLLALVPPWLGWRGESHWIAWSALLVAGTLWSAVVGWRRANRLLRRRIAERTS